MQQNDQRKTQLFYKEQRQIHLPLTAVYSKILCIKNCKGNKGWHWRAQIVIWVSQEFKAQVWAFYIQMMISICNIWFPFVLNICYFFAHFSKLTSRLSTTLKLLSIFHSSPELTLALFSHVFCVLHNLRKYTLFIYFNSKFTAEAGYNFEWKTSD